MMPGGNVCHFAGVRTRVVGTGNLIYTFYGFDKVLNQELPPVAMATPDSRTQLRLANFQSQRGFIRGETRVAGEFFRINDITIYMKPLWTEYPG